MAPSSQYIGGDIRFCVRCGRVHIDRREAPKGQESVRYRHVRSRGGAAQRRCFLHRRNCEHARSPLMPKREADLSPGSSGHHIRALRSEELYPRPRRLRSPLRTRHEHQLHQALQGV